MTRPVAEARPRILVIDDSKSLLAAVQYTLGKAGMEVFVSDNPITVGTLIRQHRPQLVLVDVEMPGLEGDKVVEIIGKHEGMRVVLYSSKGLEELRELARRSRADGFIVKHEVGFDFLRRVKAELEQVRPR
ncbi:MAG: response regulator [Deltaproteobacteria bacterium]|nr:response regulator [Deltaproteobacteria bacterium]